MSGPASPLDRGKLALCLAGHLPRPCPEGLLSWQEEQGGGWAHTSPGSVLAALRARSLDWDRQVSLPPLAERRSLVPENRLLRGEALPGILFQLILHEKRVHALLLHPKPPVGFLKCV